MNPLQRQTSITNEIFFQDHVPETRRTSTLLIGGVNVGGEVGISRSRLTTGSKLICSALMVPKANQRSYQMTDSRSIVT